MVENFAYYIFCIIAFVVAVLVLKKVASCLIKTVAFAAIVAILVAIYFMYFR